MTAVVSPSGQAADLGMKEEIDIQMDGIPPPHPLEFTKCSSSSTRTLEAVKSTGKKIRDRAMPITTRQKRSRWVPGARYMPLLLLQWLWHPIAVFFHNRAVEKDGAHDQQPDPRHLQRHESRHGVEETAPFLSSPSGDLFME
mmetsp:Transcript_1016/g.1165  ORF Transcript_1016/g.1165 Transcript_1016/m.1165 type:complete len:142 (+) Transcript_1016:243-668(+)|eukprot:CAMPEP_0204634872 /NCGR_PEP_ID=MMETSP0717-20131115/30274_1 /ASSEMBLY_ACC=CAM_ASM_000666 /TAXON_ID=230516 /ORGANISM="Chaetoceros curvisetus" /LENGTH=141 /DNA_ID=CAMNT_0051653445 /DNA_START=136 /DNA_END=561 /DNA_ORIENTATION=-